MAAYDDLMAFQRETEALGQVAGRLGWDQETVMPRGAAEQRAEEMAALEGVLHARRTDPRLGDWLAAAEAPDAAGVAQLREIRRSYERNTKVPGRLASEIARVTSMAQGVWAEARAAEDWATFRPVLENVVRLKREEGAALAAGGDVYDALLEDYEPGTSAAEIETLFGELRAGLVDLRARVLGSGVDHPTLSGTFDEAGQLALSRELALAFGYELTHGRIDKAVHPFSSGSGLDVRITTRTAMHDPFNCFYSTIHEVGHAAYEQGVDRAYLLTPIGRGASMGVHESQSRIFENQLGRSRAFCGFLLEPDEGDIRRYRRGRCRSVLWRGEPGHAGLHPHRGGRGALQPACDDALRSGAGADRRGVWRWRICRRRGTRGSRRISGWRWTGCPMAVCRMCIGRWGCSAISPPIRWAISMPGACYEALREGVPDLEAHLAEGHLAGATDWLRDNLQRHGALHAPRETITRACGVAPSPGPLLAYLNTKFGALYGL